MKKLLTLSMLISLIVSFTACLSIQQYKEACERFDAEKDKRLLMMDSDEESYIFWIRKDNTIIKSFKFKNLPKSKDTMNFF